MLLKKRGVFIAAVMLLAALQTAGLAGAEAISPTTGLPYEGPYRPVLVTISNAVSARPQWGLEDADIVYETIYWGPAHTRYLALFNDRHPSGVGPVRGARVYDVDIARGWDAPYAHAGGQDDESTSYRDAYAAYGVNPQFILDGVNTTPNSKVMSLYTRREGLVSPHNLSFDVEKFVSTMWPETEGVPYQPRLPKLQFSQTPTVGSDKGTTVKVLYDAYSMDIYDSTTGKPVPEIDAPPLSEFTYNEKSIHYERFEEGALTHVTLQQTPEYQPMFVYNEDTEQYDRFYNGRENLCESGAQLTAANVIIQYVELSFYRGEAMRPVIDTIGEGRADIFVRGRRTSGRWVRKTGEDAIAFYDEVGGSIVLAPGKTFIQMIPEQFVCVKEPSEEGSYRYARR